MLPLTGKNQFNIMDYVEILNKRKWVLGIFAALGIVAGLVYLVVVPRVYRTDTVVLIEKQVPKITQIREDVYSKEKGDVRTQYSILRSRYLAERVSKKMDLPMDPRSIDRLLSSVAVDLSGSIAVISVKGTNPVLITNIANTWTKEFIRQDIERRMGATEYGVIWLEDQLAETLEELQMAETELAELTKNNSMLAEMEDDLVNLKYKKKDLERELAASSREYGELHPKIVFLKKQLAKVRKEQEDIRDKLISYHDDLWRYRMLNDKVDASRTLYNNLLTRAKELDISKDLAVTNIRIVDIAKVPIRPVSPKFGRSMGAAIVISVIIGIGLIFLLEYLDSTLKHPEDVEVYANIPFLGFAPFIKKAAKKGKNINLLSQKDPQSKVAEAFRNIKVSLIFSSSEERPLNKIVVTSANAKDGKTFVATNLAEIFANSNEKTLLIDADMKKGDIAKTFQIKEKNGLTSVLAGVVSLEKAIVKTSTPNLSVLPSGPSAPNPSELLSSDKFKSVAKSLGSKFQRIIIDVPAILSNSDAFFWSEVADGMIQVIGGGVTPLKAIKESQKRIEGKMPIIGGILNNLEVEKDLKYYYHYFQEFAERNEQEEAKSPHKKKTKTPKKK